MRQAVQDLLPVTWMRRYDTVGTADSDGMISDMT